MNLDGYDDIVVGEYGEDGGAYDAGRAYVFSGFDGKLIHDLVSPNPETQGNFGFGIAGADDVNNDGVPDVIVGAYGEDGGTYSAGRAYVFDGNTGALLHILESSNPEQTAYFGVAVVGVGDLTDDGFGEVVVGAVYEDGGALNAGRVYVFNGQTGDVVYTLESPHPEQTGAFGHAINRVADLDDDGYSEIIVGAWLEDAPERHSGRVYVFSGKDGDLLCELTSPNPDWFGGFGFRVSDAGDIDNDGFHDVVIGTYKEDGGAFNAGRAYIYSCVTGSRLATMESPDPVESGRFGIDVAGVGDQNDNGCPDVLVGAYWEHGGASQAGRAYLYSPFIDLSSELSGGESVLSWASWPGAASYWIYGAANQVFFEPGLTLPFHHRLATVPSDITTWSSASGITDPDHNWSYLIVAVDTLERLVGSSNRVGEHDFGIIIP
jgi:hypothetical protein